jgi:hypothetical protein
MVQQPTVMMVHQPFANFQISAGKLVVVQENRHALLVDSLKQ